MPGFDLITLCSACYSCQFALGRYAIRAGGLSVGYFSGSSCGGGNIPSPVDIPARMTDLGPEEVTYRWPTILPGGKTLLFNSCITTVSGYDEASIEVMSLADCRRKTLTWTRILCSLETGNTEHSHLEGSRHNGRVAPC